MKRLAPVRLLPGCEWTVALTLVAGCTANDDATGNAPIGEPNPQSTTATTPPASAGSTTGSTSSTDTTTSLDPTTSNGSSTDDETYGQGFITDPDGGPPGIECSVIEQDCPRGEKCNAWVDDGGSFWNAAKCVPIVPDPDGIDEPCSVEGNGVSGVDSCDLGSICWDVDPRTLEGRCVPYCTGSNNAPVCEDPDRLCRINANGVLALCLPQCNPLDQQTCPKGNGCYPIDNRFTCAPDASGPDDGATFGGCEFINACGPGLFCVNPDLSVMCPPDAGGCCLPVCDLSAPECPAAMVCEPWFEPGSTNPLAKDVGVCAQDPE